MSIHLSRQLNELFAHLDNFPAFGVALSLVFNDTLPYLLFFSFALAVFQSIVLTYHSHSPATLSDTALPKSSRTLLTDLLLGIQDPFLTILVPVALLLATAMVACLHIVMQVLIWLASVPMRAVQRLPISLRRVLRSVSKSSVAHSLRYLFCDLLSAQSSNPSQSWPVQRLIGIGGLLLLIVFFAPHQFAFLVLFALHLVATIESYNDLADSHVKVSLAGRHFRLLLVSDQALRQGNAFTNECRLSTRYNYLYSNLLVLLWLLPINAPILVVWVRNLAVGWFAPFSSDHNALTIVGFVLWIETTHSGVVLPRSRNK